FVKAEGTGFEAQGNSPSSRGYHKKKAQTSGRAINYSHIPATSQKRESVSTAKIRKIACAIFLLSCDV
ncbi:MAG: hypothetical protein J6U49_04705, partial [Alistipes sp.]|nr:hypothetical protein [Alistipes sp.]